MRKKYLVVDILHSGRKGLRNLHVTSEKYDGITGSVIQLDQKSVEDYQQFDSIKFDFISTTSDYDYWNTTAILGIFKDHKDNYRIETINTIYVLREYRDGNKD